MAFEKTLRYSSYTPDFIYFRMVVHIYIYTDTYICMCIYVYIELPFYLSTYLSIYLSSYYLSIDPSICLSVCLRKRERERERERERGRGLNNYKHNFEADLRYMMRYRADTAVSGIWGHDAGTLPQLTWNLKKTLLTRTAVYKGALFRFHVCLAKCLCGSFQKEAARIWTPAVALSDFRSIRSSWELEAGAADAPGARLKMGSASHPRGSQHPIFKDSGPQNHTLNGCWEQSPQILGIWILWACESGILYTLVGPTKESPI